MLTNLAVMKHSPAEGTSSPSHPLLQADTGVLSLLIWSTAHLHGAIHFAQCKIFLTITPLMPCRTWVSRCSTRQSRLASCRTHAAVGCRAQGSGSQPLPVPRNGSCGLVFGLLFRQHRLRFVCVPCKRPSGDHCTMVFEALFWHVRVFSSSTLTNGIPTRF